MCGRPPFNKDCVATASPSFDSLERLERKRFRLLNFCRLFLRTFPTLSALLFLVALLRGAVKSRLPEFFDVAFAGARRVLLQHVEAQRLGVGRQEVDAVGDREATG